ncbi:transporter [Sphingomonas yunnanensis]|uniref:transporter n=1 Tax=Sphingomonas yunnanensis TaxID=310400 RepID=UPI001CA665CC|nr:transporter [Sphingomonas yunnanensis]MBY9063607.1 transporter [Sphingomonas yunnanensis]
MRRVALALLASTIIAQPAEAQPARPRAPLQRQLDQALRLIEAQRGRLDAQAAELAELRRRVDAQSEAVARAESAPLPPLAAAPPRAPAVTAAQGAAPGAPGDPAGVLQPPLERVGQAPEDAEQPIQLAVLDSQSSVVTRKGQLTGEFQLDYARADRSRTVFRGVELVEAVLVGVFDINESRQDVLTASAALRYGLTDRFELGVRAPFIHRADASIIAPIAGSTNNDQAATIDSSVKGTGIGDIELTARYQLLSGGNGRPYIIGNLQGVLPTGTDPFAIRRDDLGRPTRAATGAGFWGIAPSVTAILPSDPVVLFGTLGYTFNLPRDVDTRIPPVIITYVDPGDAISGSAGIGISLNQRTTVNFGYAHTWAFGTRTRTMLIEPTAAWPGERETISRDLQIGRFLFGVTYRVTDRASLNWSVEVGATEDATDLRTVLRVPVVLLTGG